jgi:predicted Rossmann-fold nucleotide-binding protein
MRILVCGGRDYDNYPRVQYVLGQTVNLDNDIIIEGGAKGADRMARTFAINYGVAHETYPADWEKAAGILRNQEMLETGIDLVIAFPGGRGTADMIRRAEKAGVEVYKVER